MFGKHSSQERRAKNEEGMKHKVEREATDPSLCLHADQDEDGDLIPVTSNADLQHMLQMVSETSKEK